MADKELDDLLSALDTPSSAKPGPVPAGLSVGKAVFSDGRPVPKHAVKVMLDVSAPLKPMTATTVNAGSSAPPATATAPAGAKYTPAPAKPAAKASGGDDIDAILGAMNFDEDADVSIGFCASCRGGITKKQQHLNVFGNRYHIQHFNCSNCKVNIGNNAFYEKPAGSPLCQGCYSRHHATNCAKCRKQITERECVRVDELKYHPHCFTCTTCNIPLSIYWERNGQPVCEKHYTERYTPRCCDCSQPIIGRILTAMGGERHPTCFKCSMCSSQIKTEEFFNNNGMPVCLKCDPRRR